MKFKHDMDENYYRKVKDFLIQNLIRENNLHYGNSDLQWINYVANAWMNDQSDSKWRYELIREFFRLDKGAKILDMASGCHTFVSYGLRNDYDVYGIEPEGWKNEFAKMKLELYGYPEGWRTRFIEAFGENLPFQDEYFDVISSYQTLKHVSDVKTRFREMLRVLKSRGEIFLHFPDYRSSFEGHYRLPWIPPFPRVFARVYLRMLGKPLFWLSSINYVTEKNIMHLLRQNGEMIELN